MIRRLIFSLCFLSTNLAPPAIVMAQQSSLPDKSSAGPSKANVPDAPSAQKQSPDAPGATSSRSSLHKASPPVVDDHTAKMTLLSNVSSKSPSGSSFMARLEHPVQVDATTVLPQGSVIEGHLETVHARRIMRPGALRMIFDRVKLPDGTIQRASFVVVSSKSKSVKADDEGELHPTISKKRLAIQLGGTAAVAKLADDVAEEAVAAGAGTARLYGLAGAGVFLFFQKGREVKLHPGDVIEAEFMREGQKSLSQRTGDLSSR